jgi:hypothetical protein
LLRHEFPVDCQQDSLAGLRLRTEQVVSENEMLHERLKENDPLKNISSVKADNICLKCGGLSYFSAKPSVAEITTLEKLSRFAFKLCCLTKL